MCRGNLILWFCGRQTALAARLQARHLLQYPCRWSAATNDASRVSNLPHNRQPECNHNMNGFTLKIWLGSASTQVYILMVHGFN